MGTKAVVVGEIRSEHVPKMPVVEDDDMIKHIATDTPNEPLAVGILPRTARGNLDFFDADVLDAVLERHTVDRVPIPEEIVRRGIPGKRLNDWPELRARDGLLIHSQLMLERQNFQLHGLA